ncbi:hypothetical protein AB0E59_41945 [Lentzea sp. NPDC034063]|uniref:hypothetical protein n=1 Tax=unclassified Lentzea TaxID=2643253 RepID=UPI0033EB671B
MSPDLRDRLLHLNAQLAYGGVEADAAVWLACDLLLAGVESPAVVELAGESPTQLRSEEAAALFEQSLAELGLPKLSQEQADWIGYRDVALDVISGRLTPDHWACCAAPMGGLGRGEELDALRAAAVHNPGEVAGQMLELARDLVRTADERINSWLPRAAVVGPHLNEQL